MSQSQELLSSSEDSMSSTATSASGGAVQNPSTSLYVGDLDESVTDSQLFEVFSGVGQVVSVRVCRDVSTRKSLGYAYVNFSETSDAARALEVLNFSPINGKPIRVMHSNRDPSSRQINEANLFVKNLDKSITNLVLYKTFSPCGSILSCKVATDSGGQSKGYGFVQFDSVESAKIAIKSLNGSLLNGKRIFVGPFVAKEDRESSSNSLGSNKFSNVFVKNLSEPTTENDLIDVFGKFGKITSVIVMRDDDGKSKCFGFVNFENPDDAVAAVEGMNGKMFDGKEWFVGKAMKKSERERELKRSERGVPEVNATYTTQNQNHNNDQNQSNNNLYLKNLEENISDDDLKELFSVFGTVTSAKVMREPNGRSKGVGFVAFESQNDASRALGEMNGKLIRSRPLYVAFAQRKDDRRAKLQEQYAMVPQMAMSPHPMGPRMPVYPHNMGQPMFFGPPPPFIPPQPGYGFQQPLVPGMRGGSMPSFMPMVPQGPRGLRPRHGGPHQVACQRGPHHPLVSSAPNHMVGGDVNRRNMQGSLASALAKSTPSQQRIILGERLFPLVNELEHELAAKITGMLLEMDRDEILHLLESPDALKSKVEEAVRVLGSVDHSHTSSDQFSSRSLSDHSDQFSSLSLNEGVA